MGKGAWDRVRVAWLVLICLPVACSGRVPADDLRVVRAGEVPWSAAPAEADAREPMIVPMPAEPESEPSRPTLRRRVIALRPDLELGQLVLASGALQPYHSQRAPVVQLVVSGEAEWTVDGETRSVGPGTTIYAAPYAAQRFLTTSREPLRVLWARFAPDGDREPLRNDRARRPRGAMTGPFFEGERRSRSLLPIHLTRPLVEPAEGTREAWLAAHRISERAQEPERPIVRTFVDSLGTPWARPLSGFRTRRIFATHDFEWGQLRVRGPGARRVFDSDSPALLHVVGGAARLVFPHGFEVEARPGTTVAVEPGEYVQALLNDPEEGGADPFVEAIWLRWAPGGDSRYLAGEVMWLEPVGQESDGDRLPEALRFHPEEVPLAP